MPIAALLDANVLVPISLCDILLRAAEQDLYSPLWSDRILDEVRYVVNARARRSSGQTDEAVEARVTRRVSAMNTRFPAALVTDWKDAEPYPNLPDSDDWHVVAAAELGPADLIVTQNLRDFPSAALPWGTSAVHPDEFLLGLLNQARSSVLDCVREQSAQTGRRGKPFLPVAYVLDSLKLAGVPKFVAAISGEM